MISDNVKTFCYENPSLIENYDKAINDSIMWHCHHRLETHTSDGILRRVFLTKNELKMFNMYYNRPASELIFLKKLDHHKLHNSNVCILIKDKISQSLIGHETSEDRKNNISRTLKKKYELGLIKKNTWSKGRHWYNNGVISTQAIECPEGFVPGRLQLNPITQETKEKISKANKGKKRSEETKRKLKEAAKFRKPISKEIRDKISNTLKMRNASIHNHWYTNGKINILAENAPEEFGFYLGRTLSDESKTIMVNALNRGKQKNEC